MTKPTWLIDTYLLERDLVFDHKFEKAVKRLGLNCWYTKYKAFEDRQDVSTFKSGDAVILYGTVNFIKKVLKEYKFCPGAYGYNQNRQCNFYMSNIPSEWFLNENHVMVTWRDFKHRYISLYDMLDSYEVFIRPLLGDKSFTGSTIHIDDFSYEVNSIEKLSSVTNETIVMVAQSQKRDIKGEFRFIIGKNDVIDGSEYRWDSKLDVRHDWPQECYDMAKLVAQRDWQLDTVYVCDVALMRNGEPRIVELNSFASAGWYNCDTETVLQRVTEIAQEQIDGKL